MKVGPVDGSAKEVRDLLENNGLKLEDYLEKPPSLLETKFIIIPVVVFLITLCTVAVLPGGAADWQLRLFYIFSFGSGTWVCASTQLRFKNSITTFCVAVGPVS